MSKYLCASWQGLIQQLVHQCGVGYYYYCLTYLPLAKQEKWPLIDIKLLNKYCKTPDPDLSRKHQPPGKKCGICNLSKFQRLRLKKKGLANFFYMRWRGIAVILHTEGMVAGNIIYDDSFFDIRDKQLEIKITELTALVVYRDYASKKFSMRMANGMYQDLKNSLADVARLKNSGKMKYEFNKINGIPAYHGVIVQKENLARYLTRQAGKHQASLRKEELRINRKRKPVKVWAD